MHQKVSSGWDFQGFHGYCISVCQVLRCWSVPLGPIPLVYQMFLCQQVWGFEYGRISSGTVFGYLSAYDFKSLSSDLLSISWGCIIIIYPPPPHPSHLYFEKNIGDSMITSLYSFHLSIHDTISSYTVASILTKFAACLSHLLGSCSIMLISDPG